MEGVKRNWRVRSMLFGTQECSFELDNCAVGVEARGKGSL